MIKCSALLAVPYLLREDVAKLFDQRNNKQPTILCRGAEIKLDDINLLEVLNCDSMHRFYPRILNNDCIALRIQPAICCTNSSHYGVYSKIDT